MLFIFIYIMNEVGCQRFGLAISNFYLEQPI